jgi:hypothetical protein
MKRSVAAAGDDGRPTIRELLDEVERHENGIDALDLAGIFINKGFPSYSVQRTLQSALDRGELQLGSRLRLRVARAKVAA